MELAVDPGRGVEDRGEHDGERADHRRSAASGRAACEQGDSDEPEPDAEYPCGPDPLVRQEPEPDQQREDRDGGLRDAGRSRVDVLLAPGDEPERERGIEQTEHERLAPGFAEAQHRRPGTQPHGEVAEQDDAGQQGPCGHQRPGREASLDPDLDEEVGGAPDRGEGEDQRPVSAGHRLRLAVLARARPVASAVPASTSPRPASAVAVTASSRKTAP